MKLKFIAQNPITWGVNKSNAKLLKLGETYTVENIEEHSWHTKVFLKEFPGVEFSSVWFEEVSEMKSDVNYIISEKLLNRVRSVIIEDTNNKYEIGFFEKVRSQTLDEHDRKERNKLLGEICDLLKHRSEVWRQDSFTKGDPYGEFLKVIESKMVFLKDLGSDL